MALCTDFHWLFNAYIYCYYRQTCREWYCVTMCCLLGLKEEARLKVKGQSYSLHPSLMNADDLEDDKEDNLNDATLYNDSTFLMAEQPKTRVLPKAEKETFDGK